LTGGGGGGAESCYSPSEASRTPQASSTAVGWWETATPGAASSLSYVSSTGREQVRCADDERRLAEFSKIEDLIRATLPGIGHELDTISATCSQYVPFALSASSVKPVWKLD